MTESKALHYILLHYLHLLTLVKLHMILIMKPCVILVLFFYEELIMKLNVIPS